MKTKVMIAAFIIMFSCIILIIFPDYLHLPQIQIYLLIVSIVAGIVGTIMLILEAITFNKVVNKLFTTIDENMELMDKQNKLLDIVCGKIEENGKLLRG
jgi:hypothetical protein